jgi:hypothetical protein
MSVTNVTCRNLMWSVSGLASLSLALMSPQAHGGDNNDKTVNYSSKSVAETPEDELEFKIDVYGWGANIGGQVASGSDIGIGLDQILENLNMALMGSFALNKGKWGLRTDLLYMDLEQTSDVAIDQFLTLKDLELKAWVVTPMVSYKLIDSEKVSLDLLAGARYLYLDVDAKINNLPDLSGSGDIWDGVIGVSGRFDFDGKWYLPYHFDIGTGQSKMTWQAFGGVGYSFKSWDLVVGYRYLEWDFDDSDKGGDVLNDLNMGGPIIGAIFQF